MCNLVPMFIPIYLLALISTPQAYWGLAFRYRGPHFRDCAWVLAQVFPAVSHPRSPNEKDQCKRVSRAFGPRITP